MPRPKKGYALADGTRVPGVTTITGRFKDSGGLLWWAFEQGKAAERGEIASLYDKRDEAADSGTRAHGMVERFIRAEDPEIALEGTDAETAAQARLGFENFRRWYSDTSLEVVEQEMALVSERHRFGGTPDAILIGSSKELCLGDWKTSSGIYVDVLLQLGAYTILWDETHPEEPITGGCHVVRFSKDHADFSHRFYSELEDAKEMFLRLRRCYDLDKALKKRLG